MLGAPAPLALRLARILAYPANSTLFGIGGVIGASRLLHGEDEARKTERPAM